jgi:hypothetical protein
MLLPRNIFPVFPMASGHIISTHTFLTDSGTKIHKNEKFPWRCATWVRQFTAFLENLIVCPWRLQNYQWHVKCTRYDAHIPLHISLTFVQVWGKGVYLKAIYCKTGGKLQARYIKVAHPGCQLTLFIMNIKMLVFVFHLHKTMDLLKSVLQTDPIYPLIWNLRWLYFQDSKQHVHFLTRFYFISGKNIPNFMC